MGIISSKFFRALLVLACLVLMSTRASAEWFIDLYGGGGFIESSDVSLQKKSTVATPSGPTPVRLGAILRDVEADDFTTAGLRFGYWFESLPYLGFGLDVFIYELDTRRQTVTADANATFDAEIDGKEFTINAGEHLPVTIPSFTFPTTAITSSIDVMGRWPLLQSADFPKGRLQPYLTLAPALLFTDDAPDVSLGAKVGAGFAWQLHKRIALFTEYRFTHFNPAVERGTIKIRQDGVELRIRKPHIETDLNTHYILAGVSFRF